MSKTKDVTKSKNEVRDPSGSGPASAYKNQPVEARKGRMRKGNHGKRGY